MKTSNKLILAFILAAFLVAFTIHAVLYTEYRKGHFVTKEKMHTEAFIRYNLPTPRVISIDGTIWVNLIPADHFALELPHKNEDPDAGMFQPTPAFRLKGAPPSNQAVAFQQRGDTLFVFGNVSIPIHRPFSGFSYRRNLPQVNIYGSATGDLLLNHGQFYLQGAPYPAHAHSARLTISNSTLWIGMQYENLHHPPAEFFDSLDIQAVNSFIVLNTPAMIDHLTMELKDSSTINDRYSNLMHSIIRSTPDSRVEFPADN